MTKRYFLEIAYKGTPYCGLQIQDNVKTVQGEVNNALQTLLKTQIETITSSRTDKGVHAKQNFLHVDIEGKLPSSFIYNLNSLLGNDISVEGIYEVESNAHARYDAIGREYQYNIHTKKNIFLQECSYYFPFKLSIHDMRQASEFYLGRHDYTSFSKRHTDVSNHFCDVSHISWVQVDDSTLQFHVRANRFLRGMVRAMVATLLQVGRGKCSPESISTILQAKNSSVANFSAPAHGLFLNKVLYPTNMLSTPLFVK